MISFGGNSGSLSGAFIGPIAQQAWIAVTEVNASQTYLALGVAGGSLRRRSQSDAGRLVRAVDELSMDPTTHYDWDWSTMHFHLIRHPT